MKHTFKIDDHIPIPPRSKYRFHELKVGQSIFIRGADITTLWSSAAHVREKTGFHFTMRTVTEDGKKGVRCWRVK